MAPMRSPKGLDPAATLHEPSRRRDGTTNIIRRAQASEGDVVYGVQR
jgi:hypothetical protein